MNWCLVHQTLMQNTRVYVQSMITYLTVTMIVPQPKLSVLVA